MGKVKSGDRWGRRRLRWQGNERERLGAVRFDETSNQPQERTARNELGSTTHQGLQAQLRISDIAIYISTGTEPRPVIIISPSLHTVAAGQLIFPPPFLRALFAGWFTQTDKKWRGSALASECHAAKRGWTGKTGAFLFSGAPECVSLSQIYPLAGPSVYCLQDRSTASDSLVWLHKTQLSLHTGICLWWENARLLHMNHAVLLFSFAL